MIIGLLTANIYILVREKREISIWLTETKRLLILAANYESEAQSLCDILTS